MSTANKDRGSGFCTSIKCVGRRKLRVGGSCSHCGTHFGFSCGIVGGIGAKFHFSNG